MWTLPLVSHRDARGAREPCASAARAGSDRQGVRPSAGRGGARPRGADVDRALLAAVPRGLRRDALLVSDDTTHRAGEGTLARRGAHGDRGLLRRRLYVARLVQ